MNSKNKTNAGDKHYKAYVGPPDKYDLISSMQFNLMTSCGLRESHKLLDIGCGSLRFGKLMIPYLNSGNYFGIEPNKWLIDEGIKHELGNEIINLKNPTFKYNDQFDLKLFNEKFDFMVAQSIFSHTSQDQIKKCLSQAKEVLSKNGFFLATFVLGPTNYNGSEWVYPGCVTYTHEFILQSVSEYSLKATKINWYHPNRQSWYILYHKDNSHMADKIIRNLFTTNEKKFSIIDLMRLSIVFNNKVTRKIRSYFLNRR